MQYTLTEPCAECPFLDTPAMRNGFTLKKLNAFASGEFPCHRACKVEDAGDQGSIFVPRSKKTPHCAGALIYLEKRNRPHQMMRICERIGLYDASKLNMEAKVR